MYWQNYSIIVGTPSIRTQLPYPIQKAMKYYTYLYWVTHCKIRSQIN